MWREMVMLFYFLSLRYLLLDMYTRKDAYEPKSEQRLYESSSVTQVTFDPKPDHIVVSSSCKIIACSSGKYLLLNVFLVYIVRQGKPF